MCAPPSRLPTDDTFSGVTNVTDTFGLTTGGGMVAVVTSL